MKKKTYLQGPEAKIKVLEGMKRAADIVKSTMGPSGRNVFIMKTHMRPWITNDGISVIQEIDFDNKFEDAGVRILLEAAYETDEKAGDGTTTATVLTHAITDHAFNSAGLTNLFTAQTTDVMGVFRKLESDKNEVVAKLMARSRKIETHEDLVNVVSASMEDAAHGKTIADAVAKVGADGFIKIEDSNDFGVHTEVIPGMQFDGVELAGAFMRSEVNDPVILVTNAKITTPNELIPAVQLINTQTLVVIAQGYEREVVSALYHAASKNGNNIIALKAPALTDDELEDVATYTKSVFLNEKTGLSISKVKPESFGTCGRVVVNKTGLAVIGGQGDTTARLEAVRAELETEKREQFTRRLNKRLGRLSGGVMIVYVGAQTDTEKRYLKLKVEDAVNAAQGALKEGVVHGGGMALYTIAGELSEDNMLKLPIMAPYIAIQDNAGAPFAVPETVLDPVIVTRTALEAAVSVARTLVTADYIIVEEEDTAAKMLVDTLTQTK